MALSKKSQIFIFDLVFSLVLLIITFSIIYSYYVDSQSNVDIYELNSEILDSISKTRINSLNDEDIRGMFRNFETRSLINVENTIAQQIVQFWAYGRPDLAINLTRIVIEPYTDDELSINLTLNNGSKIELYSKLSDDKIPYEFSTVSSSSSRLVFGFINRTSFYSDYELELQIWV